MMSEKTSRSQRRKRAQRRREAGVSPYKNPDLVLTDDERRVLRVLKSSTPVAEMSPEGVIVFSPMMCSASGVFWTPEPSFITRLSSITAAREYSKRVGAPLGERLGTRSMKTMNAVLMGWKWRNSSMSTLSSSQKQFYASVMEHSTRGVIIPLALLVKIAPAMFAGRKV